ncbi:MAG: hypothetical protein LBE09_01905, partial [Christensenellaceae bacterium]|nr:hypothetical protein [Christensenellaceae bacterium]
MLTSNYVKKALLIVIILLTIVALFACSQRDGEFTDPDADLEGSGAGSGNTITTKTPIDDETLKSDVSKAAQNARNMHTHDNPDWYVFNIEFSYQFEDYITKFSTDFDIVFQGNIHLTDNSQSELFFVFIDNKAIENNQNALKLGLYYFGKTMYVNVGGNQYYTEEINVTEVAGLIVGLLTSIGIDIPTTLANVFTAQGLGIDGLGDAEALINMVLGALYDPTNLLQTHTIKDGYESIDYLLDFKINAILNILKVAGDFLNWGTLGLPDLDPLMQSLLGFSLNSLLTKNWATMTGSTVRLITTKSNQVPVTDENGEIVYTASGDIVYEDGFYFNGLEMNIVTVPTTTYPDGEYHLNMMLSPLIMGYSNAKQTIRFENTGFTSSSKDTVPKAGLANIEIDLALGLDVAPSGTFTLGDVLGTLIDLESLGLGSVTDIPFIFPETGINYELQITLKVHFDLFDYRNTRLEITAYFYDGTTKRRLLQAYFEADVLYLSLADIKTADGQIIPNIKITNLNLNDLILSGLMGTLEQYLNPNYIRPAENAEGEPTLDIMTLIGIISGSISKDGSIISIDLTNESLNDILHMFLAGGDIGIAGVSLSVDTADILNSIKILLNINDDVSAKLEIRRIEYFKMPEFNNAEIIDTEQKRNSFVDVNNTTLNHIYAAQIDGHATIGTTNSDVGIGMDTLLSDLLGSVFDNIGVHIAFDGSGSFIANYKITAAIDINDIRNTGLSVNFYYDDDVTKVFLLVYYDAAVDTIYIDLSRIDVLKQKMPTLNFIGTLPKLKIANVGIRALLESISFLNPSNAEGLANAYYADYLINSPDDLITNLAARLLIGNLPTELYELALAEGVEEESTSAGGFDLGTILGLLTISIDDVSKALIVEADKQILAILLGIAGLPEVALAIKLQLIGVGEIGEDDGFVNIKLAVLDSEGVKVIYGDISLIHRVTVIIGENTPSYFLDGSGGFNVSDYVELTEYLEEMVISLSLEGNFQMIKGEESFFINDFINNIVLSLLGNVGVKFDLERFDVNIRYQVDLRIALSDILDIAAGNIPEKLRSEISIVVIDNVITRDMLGIYLIDNSLYLDLSYFGVDNITIHDISGLIDEIIRLINGVVETGDIQNLPLPFPTNADEAPGEGVNGINTLEIVIAPDQFTIIIAEVMVTALQNMLFGTRFLNIGDVSLFVYLGDIFSLDIQLFMDNMEIVLGIYRIELDVATYGDTSKLTPITLPDKDFHTSDSKGGMPETVFLSLRTSLYISAIPENVNGQSVNRTLNLTPALAGLLGSAGIDLTTYLQFLGVNDGSIDIEVSIAINIKKLIDGDILNAISAKIVLLTVDQTVSTVFLTAIYKGGDLYIDTDAFGIGKLHIKNVSTFFGSLFGGGSGTAIEGTALNAEDEEVIQYISIFLIQGGLTFSITKDLLIAIFNGLGADIGDLLTQVFAEITRVELSGGLNANPVELIVNIELDGINMGLQIDSLQLKIDKEIDSPEINPEDYAAYTVLENLENLRITIDGKVEFSIYGKEDGTDFDFVVQKIYEQLAGSGFSSDLFDLEALLNLGVLLKVVGEKFGGKIYYNIDVVLNPLNLMALNMSFKLTSEAGYENYGSGYGDIIKLYIISSKNASGADTLDVYLDGTGISEGFNIEKIRVSDVSGFIAGFSAPAQSEAIIPPGNAPPTAEEIANAHILINIALASDAMTAPIVLNLTKGAFEVLFNMLGIPITEFLGAYSPSASIEIGGDDSLISINFDIGKDSASDLLHFDLSLNSPTLGIYDKEGDALFEYQTIVASQSDYYEINEGESLNLKLTIGGEFSFESVDNLTNPDSQ